MKVTRGPTFIYTPLKTQLKEASSFHVCIDQGSFLCNFFINSELGINQKLTMMQVMM